MTADDFEIAELPAVIDRRYRTNTYLPKTTPFFSGPSDTTTAVLANTTNAVRAIALE